MKREYLFERVMSQTRLAVLEDNRLCEIYYERKGREKLAGNIYAGCVRNILPGMNAAFVDIGLNKNAFLYASDVSIDQPELRDQVKGARIEKMLRPGQMIVVQVIKEPGGSKGARVTCSLSLPGRYGVLLPTIRYAGVSNKICDAQERDRLYAIARSLSDENGSGVIVRTAAEGASAEEICADYAKLTAQWARIDALARHAKSPRLIQSDGSLAVHAMRDMADDTVCAFCTDDEDLYHELREAAMLYAPECADRIALTCTETPLFDLRRVDHQLDDGMKRYVWLKSGGTIVIDETEAMTVIDVNTGKFTGNTSLEDTIFRLNCEAADEIARQLRLRDIGGIIIIDFIDMRAEQNRDALIDHLKGALARDRNRTNVLGITQLGLIEMTRKKVRRPLTRQLMHDCTACLGTGREKTYETQAYDAVREIWRRRRTGDTCAYRLTCDARIASIIRKIGLPAGGNVRIEAGDAIVGYELTADL